MTPPGAAAAQNAFLAFEAHALGDLTGASVAPVGDIDGDGFGDVVIGSPG